jgi:hypothetical protein
MRLTRDCARAFARLAHLCLARASSLVFSLPSHTQREHASLHTHAHTRTLSHTRTHAHTHTYTHTLKHTNTHTTHTASAGRPFACRATRLTRFLDIPRVHFTFFLSNAASVCAPPESVRSSTSGRPIRQFSMAAAATDPESMRLAAEIMRVAAENSRLTVIYMYMVYMRYDIHKIDIYIHMHVCIYMYMFICMQIHTCISLVYFFSVYVHVCVCVPVCLSVSHSLSLFM